VTSSSSRYQIRCHPTHLGHSCSNACSMVLHGCVNHHTSASAGLYSTALASNTTAALWCAGASLHQPVHHHELPFFPRQQTHAFTLTSQLAAAAAAAPQPNQSTHQPPAHPQAVSSWRRTAAGVAAAGCCCCCWRACCLQQL
jgi:hypothetical protein